MKIIRSILLSIFVVTPLGAAITYDTVGSGACLRVSGSTPFCNSVTYSISPSAGSNRALVIGWNVGTICTNNASSIASITYNGSSTGVTQIQNTTAATCSGLQDNRIGQHYLLNEATGSNNIVITLTTTDHSVQSAAIALQGVDQTDPVRSSSTTMRATNVAGTTISATVPSTSATDLIVDFACDGSALGVPGGSQTERYRAQDTHSTCSCRGASTQPGSSGGTVSWTVTSLDISAVAATSFKAAAAADASGGGPGRLIVTE